MTQTMPPTAAVPKVAQRNHPILGANLGDGAGRKRRLEGRKVRNRKSRVRYRGGRITGNVGVESEAGASPLARHVGSPKMWALGGGEGALL